MRTLRSWRALLVREFIEHRMAFLYFPLGILAVLLVAFAAAFGANRIKVFISMAMPSQLKLFELGYLLITALWLAYLVITLFFYFGDAFSADRRNNAMFFWKSMPVSDLKVLASKFLAGTLLFPAVILGIAIVTGLIHFGVVSVGAAMLPGVVLSNPLAVAQSFLQITLFAIAYLALALLWYAPFLAWVGGLSTIFGRWSLPLAFLIPGVASVVENIAFFGNGPRWGYIWSYLGQRWQFGLADADYGRIALSGTPFEAGPYLTSLVNRIDWLSLVGGLVFAAVVVWAASEYRRRRIA